jgi:hypothetical protein
MTRAEYIVGWLATCVLCFIVGEGLGEQRRPVEKTVIQPRQITPWWVAEKNCVEVYRVCKGRARAEGIKAITFEDVKK